MRTPTPSIVIVTVLCALVFIPAGCDRPARAAGDGGVTEILTDPNVLLNDGPTTQLMLNKRRFGDASESSRHPFGEFEAFPFRYGVTNGRITSMICPGEKLKAMDVEPTAIGLQMRLGKADWIEEEREEVVLYWFARKRAAAVGGGEIKWLAVYK